MKWIRWTMVLLVAVIVVSAAAAFYFVFMGGRTIPMPAVEGMTSASATESLQKLGLVVREDHVVSQLPSGTVVSQWPVPGEKVAGGRLVILKVSRSGEKKPLPDVRGLEFNEASARLAKAGFKVGDVLRIADTDKPMGAVVAQSPSAPAMVPVDTRIDLLLSRGRGEDGGPVGVPDILGQDETAARALLVSSGLVANTRYVYTETTAPGIVTSLSPKAGTQVPAGAKVTLTVATNAKTRSGLPAAPAIEEDAEAPPVQAPETPEKAPAAVPKAPEPVHKSPDAPKTPEPPAKVSPPAAAEPVKLPPAPAATVEKPSGGGSAEPRHTAKVRYQVPPLTKPMPLRIEVVDPEGTRTVLEKEVKGGESILVSVPYVREAAVTVFLGGEFVWQDRYRP